jgi:hypothetical protein
MRRVSKMSEIASSSAGSPENFGKEEGLTESLVF